LIICKRGPLFGQFQEFLFEFRVFGFCRQFGTAAGTNAALFGIAGHGPDRAIQPYPCRVKLACKLWREGIVSKRKDSAYRSGRSPDWLKMKNPNAPAVTREAEEDWAR
jgi:hypothetical protein